MAVRKQARGSQKLLADRLGEGAKPIPKAELRKLLAISDRRGVKLVNWWIYGQPAPDAVLGTFQVKPALAAGVIKDLLALKNARLGFKVFPYGIPIPEAVLIDFGPAGLRAER